MPVTAQASCVRRGGYPIVSYFIKNDAFVPHERVLAGIEELRVARFLEQKRDVPVLELVDDDLRKLAHPTLLLAESKHIVTMDMNNNFSNKTGYEKSSSQSGIVAGM